MDTYATLLRMPPDTLERVLFYLETLHLARLILVGNSTFTSTLLRTHGITVDMTCFGEILRDAKQSLNGNMGILLRAAQSLSIPYALYAELKTHPCLPTVATKLVSLEVRVFNGMVGKVKIENDFSYLKSLRSLRIRCDLLQYGVSLKLPQSITRARFIGRRSLPMGFPPNLIIDGFSGLRSLTELSIVGFPQEIFVENGPSPPSLTSLEIFLPPKDHESYRNCCVYNLPQSLSSLKVAFRGWPRTFEPVDLANMMDLYPGLTSICLDTKCVVRRKVREGLKRLVVTQGIIDADQKMADVFVHLPCSLSCLRLGRLGFEYEEWMSAKFDREDVFSALSVVVPRLSSLAEVHVLFIQSIASMKESLIIDDSPRSNLVDFMESIMNRFYLVHGGASSQTLKYVDDVLPTTLSLQRVDIQGAVRRTQINRFLVGDDFETNFQETLLEPGFTVYFELAEKTLLRALNAHAPVEFVKELARGFFPTEEFSYRFALESPDQWENFSTLLEIGVVRNVHLSQFGPSLSEKALQNIVSISFNIPQKLSCFKTVVKDEEAVTSLLEEVLAQKPVIFSSLKRINLENLSESANTFATILAKHKDSFPLLEELSFGFCYRLEKKDEVEAPLAAILGPALSLYPARTRGINTEIEFIMRVAGAKTRCEPSLTDTRTK